MSCRNTPQLKRFEEEKDLTREQKAIDFFVNRFNGSYKKLDPNDIDLYPDKSKEGAFIRLERGSAHTKFIH